MKGIHCIDPTQGIYGTLVERGDALIQAHCIGTTLGIYNTPDLGPLHLSVPHRYSTHSGTTPRIGHWLCLIDMYIIVCTTVNEHDARGPLHEPDMDYITGSITMQTQRNHFTMDYILVKTGLQCSGIRFVYTRHVILFTQHILRKINRPNVALDNWNNLKWTKEVFLEFEETFSRGFAHK
jgi:hypothetical protein